MFDWTEILEMARKAAGVDAALASSEELFAAEAALAELRGLVEVTDAHLIAEVEARDAANLELGLRTSTWVAREGKMSLRTAKRRVKVANALRRQLPGVADALAEGVVSADHAAVLADAVANPRVGKLIEALADELVAESVGMVFERWRDHVRAMVELLDEDGGYDPSQDPTQQRCSYATTMDGVTHIDVTLTGDDADATLHAWNAMADELYRRYAESHAVCPEIEIPARSQLLAEAIVELSRRGGAVDERSTTPPRPEVTYVVRQGDPDAYHPDGTRAGAREHLTRCCDADIYAVVMNRLGQPVDLSRHARLATPHQRRAIACRDGGCVFPGCGRPVEWLDIHHADWWERGGHTNVDRMCGLCRFHHGVAHRKGWHLDMDAEAWAWFETPSGHCFWGQRHGKQRAGPAPPPRPRASAA